MKLLDLITHLNQFEVELGGTKNKLAWTTPPDLKLGLLTTNAAFTLSKGLDLPPVQIATDITKQLQNWAEEQNLPVIVQTAGPYVNLDLKANSLTEAVTKSLISDPNPLGQKTPGTLLLEYVSPNVAKPLHAGHIRNANLGEALRRILSLKYEKVITDNHWADWGVQFGVLLWGWKEFEKRRNLSLIMNNQKIGVRFEDYQLSALDTLVKVYVWANQQKEKVENWDNLVRDEFLALERGDERNLALSREFVEVSKVETRRDLEILNVHTFDYEYGESYYLPDVRDLQEFLNKYQIWQTEDEARFFDFEHIAQCFPEIDEKTRKGISLLGRCYLISSNGYSTYAFRDVAARINWARDLEAETMITVTGNEQNHHFKQFFAITAYLATLPEFREKYGKTVSNRLTLKSLIHISYGFLSLPEGKMSTRKGNILTAKDLVNQVINEAGRVLREKNSEAKNLQEIERKVAIAALKWFDLNRDSTADIVLNMQQILAFEGNTGVYQLYTLARLNSILEKNQSPVAATPESPSLEFNPKLLNPEEILILKKTLLLPLVLEQITHNYKPHLLCTHLFELATMVNSWYAKPDNSVSAEQNTERKQALLAFCTYLKNHIGFGLDLLGIDGVDAL
jgi:arginyl-tRNA synthetase